MHELARDSSESDKIEAPSWENALRVMEGARFVNYTEAVYEKVCV